MKVNKTYHPRLDQIAMILLEDFKQNNIMFSQKCFKIYPVMLSIHPTIALDHCGKSNTHIIYIRHIACVV